MISNQRRHFDVHRKIATSPQLSAPNESLITEYLLWKKSYSKTAFRQYRSWVIRFQDFVNKHPEEISHIDYTKFANSIRVGYSPKSVEFALNIVHNYLRYFAEQGRLNFPMYLVRVPRADARSHAAFNEREYTLLVGTMRATKPFPLRDLTLIMLLHDTGMRVGELLSLRVEDFDAPRSAVVKTEKSTSFRRVYWSDEAETLVRRFSDERRTSGAQGSHYFFVGNSPSANRALWPRTVQRMLKRHLEAAGVTRKLCPHSFRHSFIHRLSKLSVPDAIIAQLVGHKTPHTISHYTKLSRPELRVFAERQLAFAASEPEMELTA